MPDEASAEAERTGELWSGFPVVDLENLQFESDRFGLLFFNKMAFQIPEKNFGNRRYWHVQLNLHFASRKSEYMANAKRVKESEDLWREYSESYDAVLKHYPKFNDLVERVVAQQDLCENCLDIGSGTGNAAMRLLERPSRKVTAIEPNDAMLRRFYEKLENSGLVSQVRLLKGDAQTVVDRIDRERADEEENGVFDGCVMMNVLYALQAPEECLKSVFRVLKPGGTLTISTPRLGSDASVDDLFRDIERNRSSDAVESAAWNSFKKVNRLLAQRADQDVDHIRQMVEEATVRIGGGPNRPRV